MANEAEFNIIVGVQNRERIKQLENDISDAEKEIIKLSQAINTAGKATTEQATQLKMYGRDITAHRQEIGDLAKANIQLGESIERHGISSVRTMTRMLYQMDEGAKGLMYTLPTLAEQLGVAGPLAAGIGIVAVSLVELGKHWEDIQDIFDNREGIDRAKSNLESLVEYMDGLDSTFGRVGSSFLGMFKESSEQGAIKRKIEGFRQKRVKQGEGILEGPSDEEEQRGKLFRAAAKAYGPDKLLEEAVQQETGGRDLTPSQQDEIERIVKERTGRGAAGEEQRKGLYGPGFEKELQAQQNKADFLLEQKAKREEKAEGDRSRALIDADKKAQAAKQKKWETDEENIMRSDEEFNKKRQEGILQDQLTKLERQKRDQAEGFRENQLDNKFTFHRGGQAIAEAYQTDAGTAIQKNQLDVQKKMQIGIDAVKDELSRLRKIGIGAHAQ